MHRLTLAPLAAGLALPAAADGQADAAWDLLSRIERTEVVTDDSYAVLKRFPPEIADGADVFEISGFLVPMGFGAETTDFMLIPEAGMCPFCGSSDHGLAIQVAMADPLPAVEGESRVTLRGALHAVTDPQTFQSVVMTDAVTVGG
ncbi:hypothetical protein [Jannaschia sp. LMIT008]|uniref:hypothetical protein n=1 Tax=Jannaschia maritima TaxID=3032585 RepID=UPI0028126AFD|nr:hypothetical protein [Jannaschia sp. LMIT008]